MSVYPFLSGLVIIWTGQQSAIGAQLFRLLRQFPRFLPRIGSAAGDDLAAPMRFLNGDFDDAQVFIKIERSGLAGGSCRNNSIHAVVDLELNQFAERGFVYLTVLEGGDDGCVGACKHECAGLWNCDGTFKNEVGRSFQSDFLEAGFGFAE